MWRFLAAVLAASLLAVPAAAETVEELRPKAIEWCKAEFADPQEKPEAIARRCDCFIDGVIRAFGDDAVKMLKILGAGLSPGDVAEIAKLLGIGEADAQAFVSAAEKRMSSVEQSCAS